tara:strand:- start:3 stop:596 length:594 start_codon:yes stop_codon:yes gene_type:complete
MDPKISCILNALDEVKVNMKDNDYKVAVEALATLNTDNTKEYILTMAKLMPEMEIGSNNEITINVSREMIQSKFKLSSDSLRYIKSLIGSGSISINLSTVPPTQQEELERVKRAIYNISSKNTVTQTLDCHKRGSPCNCLTRKKVTHCCSSVILLGISLYDPEPEPEETNEDGDYGATIEFYPNLRLAVAGLNSQRE